MQVFKFGGASVKDAKGVENVANILQLYPHRKLVVVVSAMGKTTNALERVLNAYCNQKDVDSEVASLIAYHSNLMRGLFSPEHPIWSTIEASWSAMKNQLQQAPYDFVYDQVVSYGEIVSTQIVSAFLETKNIPVHWVDARTLIVTDDNFREGIVDWTATRERICTLSNDLDTGIVLTQGFIGGSRNGATTTLGRDGSDFSAAIFASCLDADAVTIWKDVPGIMNADPKKMEAVTVFEKLPFREAAEMTYYGASVIHPKTIKPLATKGIPLLVKNFDDPSLPGTKIFECHVDRLPPLFVFKENQCLISCKVTDYTFITEDQISKIFQVLNELNLHANVMQNSAISFSFCLDFRESKVMSLIERLQRDFEVYYNVGLTLITIKNYDEASFEKWRKRPGVLLEQSSRSTMQLLLKSV